MHTRRLLSLLLGVWFGCSLLVLILAYRHTGQLDGWLSSNDPLIAASREGLGETGLRALLAREADWWVVALTRFWSLAQMAWGTVVLATALWLVERSRTILLPLAGALALVALQYFLFIAPAGQLLAHWEPLEVPAARLDRLRSGYLLAEVVKLSLLGIVMLRLVLSRRTRRRLLGHQIDAIDNPNHSRLDWREHSPHSRHRTETFRGEQH